MRAKEARLERQVQFWSVLGPFFILLTFLITCLHGSSNDIYLGTAALVAIPVCWKWKMYGLAGVIGVLAAIIVFNYNELTPIERFWQAGVALATAVGCVVTTLSFEEAENLVQNLQVQSDSRLDNLWHLDEKIKSLQQEASAEKEALSQELREASALTEKLRSELDSLETLSKIQREELQVASGEKQKLLEETFQAREDAGAWRKKAEESRKEVAVLRKSAHAASCPKTDKSEMAVALRQAEGKYRQLSRQFKEKAETLDATRKELFITQEKLLVARREMKDATHYSRSEIDKEVDRYLISLSEALERQEREYEDEIESLHGLIASLFHKS